MSDINYYRAIEDSKHFLDFLHLLIPQHEVEIIYKYCQELNSRTITENYKLSYSEQCNLVLDKFFDSDFCSVSSKLPEHIEVIEKVDSNTVENVELFFSDETIIPSNFIKFANDLLNNKKFIEAHLDYDSMSSQQKEIISQCISGKTKIDKENFSIVFPTLEDIKDLYMYYYSLVDKERFKKQAWSEVSTIQSYRTAKAIHDLYKEIYDICLASRQDKYDLCYWYNHLDSLRFYNQEAFCPYSIVFGAFLHYQHIYSNEWSDYLFFKVKAATCQVQDKIGFIRFLNSKEEEGGSRFAGIFVEWLKDIQETNKEVLVDTNVIKQRTPIPGFAEGNPMWYEAIPNTKIKEKRSIIECLDNLYQELIKKEWIPEYTNKELFIYRLSGQRGPYDMSFSMEWTSIPATLGKIIRCLYATSDTKPPYKKIQQFFGIAKDINLAGATKIPSYNKPAEDIIQLLESCGFKNVDVF